MRITTLLIYGCAFFVFAAPDCYSQVNENSIFGNVYDKTTRQPIEDVNVYISNTTWGSSTNKEGYYKIRQIPEGIHELVVTIIGYKYETKSILVKKDSQLKFDFYLEPVIYETEATIVEGTVPTDWLRDLHFFKYYFLGKSDFAQACDIENEEILNFSRPNSTFFIATADKPLKIINHSLGYQIDCVLVNFSYEQGTDVWRWSTKPKFTELEAKDRIATDHWLSNRRKAYQGSLYHFLRSFKEKKLHEEGFDIYPNVQAGEKIPMSQWRSVIVDYEDYIHPGVLEKEKKLSFINFLYVVYDNHDVSWIGLNYTDITLDEYGYPEEDNPYNIYGYWSTKGVADLLPKNFDYK